MRMRRRLQLRRQRCLRLQVRAYTSSHRRGAVLFTSDFPFRPTLQTRFAAVAPWRRHSRLQRFLLARRATHPQSTQRGYHRKLRLLYHLIHRQRSRPILRLRIQPRVRPSRRRFNPRIRRPRFPPRDQPTALQCSQVARQRSAPLRLQVKLPRCHRRMLRPRFPPRDLPTVQQCSRVAHQQSAPLRLQVKHPRCRPRIRRPRCPP